MSKVLNIEDLHPSYAIVSSEEAIMMANLGASVYGMVRERLHSSWSAMLGPQETLKADIWRSEGRIAAFDEFKAQLLEAERLSQRLAIAEGTIETLRTSVEDEVSRRLMFEIEKVHREHDMIKATEVAGLKEALAKAEGQSEAYSMLAESHKLMREKIQSLEEELSTYQLAATKSSHEIGKQGEATVWEMIEHSVLPEFPYSEAKNMSAVRHSADFHLWTMLPNGKRVKILIDSKKYKRVVDSEEINKLCKDVDRDNDAHAGIMVSLVSQICTMKQFQIKLTDCKKPVLFISFHNIEEGYQSSVLCWGIRALLYAIHDSKEDHRTIEQVDQLLSGINTSLKDVDVMIKSHLKMIESLRSMKGSIIQRINEFNGVDDGKETVDEAGTDGLCITIIRATGEPCGKPVFNGGAKCRHHTSSKEKAARDVVTLV